MKIMHISDTHGKHRELEKMFPFPLDCNTIVHSGDMSMGGTLYEIKDFFEWFSGLYQFENKICIAGNHDILFQDSPELVRTLIPDNVIYLENSGVDVWGVSFWGSPFSPKFGSWAFMKESDDLLPYWQKIPDGIDVLITHCPPYGILDYVPYVVYSGRNIDPHVGCRNLFTELNRIRPKAHLFGHIHPSYGKWETETCTFYNAAVVTERSYRVANPPIIFEI